MQLNGDTFIYFKTLEIEVKIYQDNDNSIQQQINIVSQSESVLVIF